MRPSGNLVVAQLPGTAGQNGTPGGWGLNSLGQLGVTDGGNVCQATNCSPTPVRVPLQAD